MNNKENQNFLSQDIVKAYNSTRILKTCDKLCVAPFSNMYFNTYGQASACWHTLVGAPRYPQNTIHDMWFGSWFAKLRENIETRALADGCSVCKRNINDRLFKSTLAQVYDCAGLPEKYPKMMEFELSNQCNLACIMCKGFLSSTIRRDRDRLPPLENPYDENFVDQLEEFIPHLLEVRFYGGEPFLQKICWEIWERISKINPSTLIVVTTNGTTLTDKQKRLIEKGRFRFNVSLDSLDKENYERIRVNSHFESVMTNLKYLVAYCNKIGTEFHLQVNPMRVNWHEMPKFVEFCTELGIKLRFNTVWRPYKLALWTMPSEDLQKVHDSLSTFQFEEHLKNKPVFEENRSMYFSLVTGQIKVWIEDQKIRESESRDFHTNKLRENGSKKEFLKLAESLSERGLISSTEEFTMKAAALEQQTSLNFDENSFYSTLLGTPENDLIYNLSHKSVPELTEWIYFRDGYY